MKILLFGATGIVGQGVLRACLLDPDVEMVRTIGRSATYLRHAKLTEIVHEDLWHYNEIAANLTNFDACFFCLGVSSSGMNEKNYAHVTYDITLAAADILCRLNSKMTFNYVSGAGTDSSEHGRVMWARIKGRTENALMRLPFSASYMFRPGVIEPRYGARSRTAAYRVLYLFIQPVLPILRKAFPNYVVTTEQIGQAMLNVAKHGHEKRILGSSDIRAAAGR